MDDIDNHNIKLEFGSYLMGAEEPLKSFSVAGTRIILTNERLICLRKFPRSFIPVFYDDILSIEHHTYIRWSKLVKALIFFAVAVYFYYDSSLIKTSLSFLEETVPELSGLLSGITPTHLMESLVLVLCLLGIYSFIQFLLSFTGRLRISVKGAPSIRIRTNLNEGVSGLMRDVEAIKKRGVKGLTDGGAAAVEFRAGGAYIMREYRPDKSVRMFFDEVGSGLVYGLYVSRTNPKDISDRDDRINVLFYWLTESITDANSISPEPERIFALITGFLEKNPQGKTIVFFDGIEYLITHSNFDQVLHLIQGLVDKIGVHSSKLVIPLNPDALSEREMALMEREVTEVF